MLYFQLLGLPRGHFPNYVCIPILPHVAPMEELAMHTTFLSEYPEGRSNLGDLHVTGRILNSIFENRRYIFLDWIALRHDRVNGEYV
jgi:hypothetical protein